MNIPPIVYDIIRWVTILLMTGGVVTGGILGLLNFPRQTSNRWQSILFSLLLIAFALTLCDKLWAFSQFAQRHLRIDYLPFYLSFALGPLLFFYVKSRLYPTHFTMKKADFKHFILPTVQFVLLAWVGIQNSTAKTEFQIHYFSPFSGNFEKAVFIIQFFLYQYFSYRFILHEKHPLSIRAARNRESMSNTSFRRQVLVVSWLKRMVKVLFILFGVHAFFILTDYFSYRLWDINLRTKALFSSFYELSFAAMVYWLCLNAYFAWRRGL